MVLILLPRRHHARPRSIQPLTTPLAPAETMTLWVEWSRHRCRSG